MQVTDLMAAAYAGQRAAEKTGKAAKETAVTMDGTANEAVVADLSPEVQAHGEAIKGLSAEQIDVLKDGIAKSQELMIKTLTESNAKLQSWLDAGIGFLNFDGVEIEAWNFALPPVGTTPEEAEAAISEGGDYSVEKVADRIFNLAVSIAGDDPERLQAMIDAVEEGFNQAGIAFGEAFDGADMPQITKDTHDEIMRRFGELMERLTHTEKGDAQ